MNNFTAHFLQNSMTMALAVLLLFTLSQLLYKKNIAPAAALVLVDYRCGVSAPRTSGPVCRFHACAC
jgi:hypothetical protein